MSNNETAKALPATILAIHSEKDETICRELLIVTESPRPARERERAVGLTSHETKQIDARHRTRQGQSAVELSPQTQLEEQTRRRARRAARWRVRRVRPLAR